MNKLLLPILLISFSSLNYSYAQQRSINLKMLVSAPVNGAEFQKGAPIPLKLGVENLGPDALKAGDTLFVIMPDEKSQLITLPQPLASGQTAIFVDAVINIEIDRTSTIDVCAEVIADPSTSVQINGQSVSISYIDPDAANNKTCNRITIKVPSTAINDVITDETLAIYPNPATTSVYLPIDKPGDKTVSITDITGRKILQNRFTESQTAGRSELDLNISQLPEGLYVVELNDGKSIRKGKLQVQH